jgi:hypothetical protein
MPFFNEHGKSRLVRQADRTRRFIEYWLYGRCPAQSGVRADTGLVFTAFQRTEPGVAVLCRVVTFAMTPTARGGYGGSRLTLVFWSSAALCAG